MSILFDDIVFGPVKSRRLGVSLGVNLLPRAGKVCNFDCIYCECGLNENGRKDSVMPSEDEVVTALERRLTEYCSDGGRIDTITFSGNGEPTLHPDFSSIVDKTLELREKYTPGAKVSVLTNGTMTGRNMVRKALLKVDNAIIKIDSAFNETARMIDRPQFDYSLKDVEENLKFFEGSFVLQTMFLRGESIYGKVDNTTTEELEAWYGLVERVKPRLVMIYTIDRDTPVKGLEKVSVEELEKIANGLREKGFEVMVSG
jgi:wyosine [tRNA(Phe)-imidazoG37] synthetase (radical SAM superfamily)